MDASVQCLPGIRRENAVTARLFAPATSCPQNNGGYSAPGGSLARARQATKARSQPTRRPSDQSARPRIPPKRSLESISESHVNLCPRNLNDDAACSPSAPMAQNRGCDPGSGRFPLLTKEHTGPAGGKHATEQGVKETRRAIRRGCPAVREFLNRELKVPRPAAPTPSGGRDPV